MSFFRRIMGSLGHSLADHHGVQVGDQYVKTDGKYQSVWTVRQIVHFEGIPPHARIMPERETHMGYRTISVVALTDADFYRRVPSDPRHGTP